MWILGISAYYHDSAAALINNGKIVAAAQEERFCRQKHYAGFPLQAIQYCLAEAEITLDEIDNVVFYDKPFLKFERLLETYHAFAPMGFRSFMTAMPIWLKEKLFQKRLLIRELQTVAPQFTAEKLLFSEHHLSHAASAFYPSPFNKALILIMDGVGEWATTSVMLGEGNTIQPLKEIHFPHSLGLLYSAFTYFTGFKVNSGEYKLMGLAPYGKPVYADLIRKHLIDIHDDGSFHLDMHYFNYCTGLTMTSRHFERLFGRGPRAPESEITQMDMDLARSIQVVTEEVILKLAGALRREYDIKHLCLAGGVALNSVANGKLLQSEIFDSIWIQPAAGDAGGAIGAALTGYHLHHQKPRTATHAVRGGDSMQGSFLGPSFDDTDIMQRLDKLGAQYQALDEQSMIEHAAQALADGKVIGWFQGRMEFGPRALGARSILADPRSAQTQAVMNLKIKFRESFRPFAPSVLAEDASEYFELAGDSPYMLLVAPVRQSRWRQLSAEERSVAGLAQVHVARSDIPAVTHVDHSARIQTVDADTNPRYHRLIQHFKQLTGYGIVVNTSFNVRGEPIVCTPEEAYRCFQKTAMDELYIGEVRLLKPK
ncbi:Nodulation protein nolO [hydrothermal vent metagenome]|uniref:Nodulation protein nolO n=1 Tax=hydrothermal vent metagenome TaxID=652676 RepID=A0A3B0Z7Z2_9ZZZZ